MKKLFFLFALVLMSTISFASKQSSNQNFKGEIVVNEISQSEQIKTKLIFSTLNDFRSFDLNQLDANLESSTVKCMVEIEVSVTVSVGVLSATITLKASGIPCSQVKEKIKSLVADAKAAALASLS